VETTDDQVPDVASHRETSLRSPSRRGWFVVVAGPDGVGKTSVARALCRLPSQPARYFHFRPLVWTPLLTEPPSREVVPPSKGSPRGSRVLGWVRLVRNFARFWIGYLTRVLPATRRGVLVVGDRWAYGYLTQPFMLKYYGPRTLAALAVRLLPEPDAVVNLVAAPEVILSRKRELTESQIRDELRRWAELPVATLRTFDATETPETVAGRVMAHLVAVEGEYPRTDRSPDAGGA
jgi:thymidylate kinase